MGAYIRRGDFSVLSQVEFDVNAFVWPAVPDWWYEHVMSEIQKAVPDAVFFVSCSGSVNAFPSLRKNFEVFDLPAESPYAYKEARHQSSRHPAADLFALGCCTTLIGSTCSTFTHYTASMLGGPTTILVPPSHKIFPSGTEFCRLNMHGRGAFDRYGACRTGKELHAVADARSLPICRGANVHWT